MPANGQPGRWTTHYDWSPITTRAPLAWPGRARVALCVIVSLSTWSGRRRKPPTGPARARAALPSRTEPETSYHRSTETGWASFA